jgi:hypothetical protein
MSVAAPPELVDLPAIVRRVYPGVLVHGPNTLPVLADRRQLEIGLRKLVDTRPSQIGLRLTARGDARIEVITRDGRVAWLEVPALR